MSAVAETVNTHNNNMPLFYLDTEKIAEDNTTQEVVLQKIRANAGNGTIEVPFDFQNKDQAGGCAKYLMTQEEFDAGADDGQLETLKQQLADAQADAGEKSKAKQGLDDAIGSLEKALDDVKAEVTTAQSEVTKRDDLEREIRDLETQWEEKNSKLKRGDSTAEVEGIDATIKTKEGELANLQSADDLQKALDKARTAHSQAEEKLQLKRKELTKATEEAEAADEEVERLKLEMKQLKSSPEQSTAGEGGSGDGSAPSGGGTTTGPKKLSPKKTSPQTGASASASAVGNSGAGASAAASSDESSPQTPLTKEEILGALDVLARAAGVKFCNHCPCKYGSKCRNTCLDLEYWPRQEVASIALLARRVVKSKRDQKKEDKDAES